MNAAASVDEPERAGKTSGWTWLAWSPRADRTVAAALGIASFLVAWAHRTRFLYAWDSVLFALGVEDYDFVAARPHPPAYPLYIASAKLVALALHDANAALVLLSALSGGVALGLTYLLLREFVARPTALAGSALLAAAPNFFLGQLEALSYMAECAFSVGLALFVWRSRMRAPLSSAFGIAVILGLALGLRPSSLFFLTPLALWGMVDVSLRSRRPWQPWLVAIVAGAVVCLLWAVPAAIAGGGWSAWIRTTQGQSRYLVFADTVVNHGGRAVSAHLHVFLPFVHAELPLVLAAAALGAAAAVLGRLSPEMPRRGRIRPWTFFSVWALPSIGFYILIFVNGPPGYTLVFLPAVYVALAVATERFATRVRAVWKGGGQASMPWIPSLAAAILLLTALPQVAADTRDTYHHDVTQREAQWQAWLDLLDPSTAMDTAVLTDERYEHAKWYRPDHAVFTVGTRLDANGHVTWHWVFEARHHQDDVEIWNIDLWRSSPPHPLDPGIRRIVIIEPFLVEGPRALVRPDAPLRSGTLDDGTSYSYIEVGPGSHTLEEYLHLEPAS